MTDADADVMTPSNNTRSWLKCYGTLFVGLACILYSIYYTQCIVYIISPLKRRQRTSFKMYLEYGVLGKGVMWAPTCPVLVSRYLDVLRVILNEYAALGKGVGPNLPGAK